MGYIISSVFAVSPNDKHAYFVYYIPADSFASVWVDEWLRKNFWQIAQSIGPKGVIIAPSPNHNQKFFEELLELDGNGCFFHSVHDEVTGYTRLPEWWKDPNYKEFYEQEEALHGHSPIVVFSRTPLSKEGEATIAYVMNLEECRDERELGQVFDVLITTIENDDLHLLEPLSDLLGKHKQRRRATAVEAMDALELKPNIFGVGVNFNYLLKKLALMVIERKKGDPK